MFVWSTYTKKEDEIITNISLIISRVGKYTARYINNIQMSLTLIKKKNNEICQSSYSMVALDKVVISSQKSSHIYNVKLL